MIRRARALPLIVLLSVLGLATSTAAQENPAPGWTIADLDVVTHPVAVDGVDLYYVRGVSAFPAHERARVVTQKILEAARNPDFDPERMEIKDSELGKEIWGGDHRITVVLDADARIEGIRPGEMAVAHVEVIRRAIKRYRADRTREALTTSALRAMGVTSTLVLALALFLPLSRKVDRLVERRWRRRAQELEEKSFDLLRAERLRAIVRGVLNLVRFVVVFVLFYIFLTRALDQFPWTRFISARLTSWVVDPLVTIGQAFVDAIPDLLFLAILTVVVRWGLKLLRLFFDGIGRGAIKFEGFEQDWAWPTYKIVRFAIVAFAVVVAYPYIPGSGSDAFKGVSLFVGVILSLGSSTAVANMIAGLAMTYRRAFRVGDRIKVGDIVGDVTEVRLQVTHVHTPKNEEVVIPNAKLLNTEVTNYSTVARTQGLILHTVVGIGYEVPWRQVEAMLLMAADRTPGLKKDPKPFVLQRGLADYAVHYELNVLIDDARAMYSTYSALHRSVQDVFNEYGVQIMTPSYVADPPDAKVVPKSDWHAAPAPSEPKQE